MFPFDTEAKINFVVQFPEKSSSTDNSISAESRMARGRVMLPEEASSKVKITSFEDLIYTYFK